MLSEHLKLAKDKLNNIKHSCHGKTLRHGRRLVGSLGLGCGHRTSTAAGLWDLAVVTVPVQQWVFGTWLWSPYQYSSGSLGLGCGHRTSTAVGRWDLAVVTVPVQQWVFGTWLWSPYQYSSGSLGLGCGHRTGTAVETKGLIQFNSIKDSDPEISMIGGVL